MSDLFYRAICAYQKHAKSGFRRASRSDFEGKEAPVSPAEVMAILLKYKEGLPGTHIARLLDVKPHTVYNTTRRFRLTTVGDELTYERDPESW